MQLIQRDAKSNYPATMATEPSGINITEAVRVIHIAYAEVALRCSMTGDILDGKISNKFPSAKEGSKLYKSGRRAK